MTDLFIEGNPLPVYSIFVIPSFDASPPA